MNKEYMNHILLIVIICGYLKRVWKTHTHTHTHTHTQRRNNNRYRNEFCCLSISHGAGIL